MCMQVWLFSFCNWVQKCVQKHRCPKFCTSAHVPNVYDVHAGFATRVCLQKVMKMCAKVWICKILNNVRDVRAGFATRVCLQLCVLEYGCAKFCTFKHVRNVHMQNVCDTFADFAIMCAKVWICEILHIHTRAKCVPFLSLLCWQLPKYRRANLLIYLNTKLSRLLWKKLFYKSKSTSI